MSASVSEIIRQTRATLSESGLFFPFSPAKPPSPIVWSWHMRHVCGCRTTGTRLHASLPPQLASLVLGASGKRSSAERGGGGDAGV